MIGPSARNVESFKTGDHCSLVVSRKTNFTVVMNTATSYLVQCFDLSSGKYPLVIRIDW